MQPMTQCFKTKLSQSHGWAGCHLGFVQKHEDHLSQPGCPQFRNQQVIQCNSASSL